MSKLYFNGHANVRKTLCYVALQEGSHIESSALNPLKFGGHSNVGSVSIYYTLLSRIDLFVLPFDVNGSDCFSVATK